MVFFPHMFVCSNRIEIAYQEVVALKRQEELIREEEEAEQAENERREKRAKKKQVCLLHFSNVQLFLMRIFVCYFGSYCDLVFKALSFYYLLSCNISMLMVLVI